jgi:hypothetical protein
VEPGEPGDGESATQRDARAFVEHVVSDALNLIDNPAVKDARSADTRLRSRIEHCDPGFGVSLQGAYPLDLLG